MLVEVMGFLAGAVVFCTAWIMMLRHERWKAIRAAYGGDRRQRSVGNALIWPSR